MHFWISKDGVTQGPYAESQLRSMWQNGAITADCVCWREGLTSWVSVASIMAAKQSKGSTQPVRIPQLQNAMSSVPSAHRIEKIAIYSPSELMTILSYREGMVYAYLFGWIIGIITPNSLSNLPPLWLMILVLSAVACGGMFFVLVRSLKGGMFAASLAFIAVFIPFVCLATAIFLYSWANRKFRDAGIKVGSASLIKNQIRRMEG